METSNYLQKIDSLLAVHAFGLYEDRNVPGGLRPGPWFRNGPGTVFFSTNPHAPTSSLGGRYRSPSQNVKDAIDAATAILKKDSRLSFGLSYDKKEKTWVAKFSRSGVSFKSDPSSSESLAISTAILRVLKLSVY